jgi:hypothetical protein
MNLVWYGKIQPTRADEVSQKIQTIHKEIQRYQKELDNLKLASIAARKDREKETVRYVSLLESSRQALQRANHALIQIHAAVEIAHREKGVIDATQPDDMDRQALRMQSCIETIKVSCAPFFTPGQPSPLDNYCKLSQTLYASQIKLETLHKNESSLLDSLAFTEARVHTLEHQISHLRRTLSIQEPSPGTMELLDDFMKEACAFDIDGDI